MASDFHQYMQNELQLEGAACKKYMEAFKKVIRYASKENHLDPKNLEDLFEDIKIKVPKAKRVFLEPREIKAWREIKFSKDQPELERDRDLFLFQIYTGYYYKDLFIFTKNQLLEDEQYGNIIHGARDKNGNETIIPLFKFPYAAAIIRKYKSTADAKTVFDRGQKYLKEVHYQVGDKNYYDLGFKNDACGYELRNVHFQLVYDL